MLCGEETSQSWNPAYTLLLLSHVSRHGIALTQKKEHHPNYKGSTEIMTQFPFLLLRYKIINYINQ